MSILELTKEDYAILIEATDSWVNRRTSGNLIGGLLESMLADKTPEARAELEARREREKIEEKQQRAQDEEIAPLLKSKLILLKNNSAV